MCLTAEKGKYFMAKQDITCYKVVYLEDNGKWTSAYGYNNKEFEFDKVLAETKGRPKTKKEYPNFVELEKGYFHSRLQKYAEITPYANVMIDFRWKMGYPSKRENFIMCECTIPKGSVYYKDWQTNDLASRKIIVHKPKNHQKQNG